MKRRRGAVVYQGPSMLDGKPIVAILTGLDRSSKNPKTGKMAQLWIVRADVSPLDALRSGEDESICGDCPLRRRWDPILRKWVRVCYVNVGQAPQAVWKAFKRGAYGPPVDPTVRQPRRATAFGGEMLTGSSEEYLPDVIPATRLGAYGDPAAVPEAVLRGIVERAPHWTGYTHQWRRPDMQWLAALCMASADSAADVTDAAAMGWRTFGLTAAGASEPVPGTIWCPATPEGGMRSTCETCGLCAGQGRKAKSISIRAHGSGAGNLITLGGAG